jgi:MoaA/NifB/PqqE/SkfB family radical SAM enzyme
MTYRCPSRCRICEIWKWEEMGIAVKDKELSLEDWKKFVDMLAELKIVNIEIFGGEALLRKDIVLPLVKYISDKGIEADVVTNGLTMTELLAKELVNSGLHDLYFSVDGVGKDHDYVRRVKGNFKKIEKGIKYVLEARGDRKNPKITCNCTISALNVDNFEKILPFAAEIGVDSVHFEYAGEVEPVNVGKSTIDGIAASPYFKTEDDEISYKLTEDQAVLLKTKIANIKKEAKHLGIGASTKNIDILTVDNLVSGRFPNKKCYMIRYFVAVDPYGNIMGCPWFNNYHIGNFREQHMRSIWNNKKHRQFMRAQKRGEFDMCTNCIMGVQRNATLFEMIQKWYMKMTKTGKDSSIDDWF